MFNYFDPLKEQSLLEKQKARALKWIMISVFFLMVILIVQSFFAQEKWTASDYFLIVGQLFVLSILFTLRKYGLRTASNTFSIGAVAIMTIVINIFDQDTVFTKYTEEFYLCLFVLVFISLFASRKILLTAAIIFFISSLRVSFYLQETFPDQITMLKEVQIFYSFTLINISLILYFVTKFSDKALETAQSDARIKAEQNRALENYRNNLEELVEQKTNDLKQAQSQLVQSEKMASLGIMTAGVAHEINNPLNFIKGSYEGLKNYFEDKHEENVNKLLNALEIGVTRASDIVKGLNQFSRDKDSNDDTCEINSIIDNCLLILKKQYEPAIRINKKLQSGTLELEGNTGKLHQVFMNILINSIHAIDDEGEITIQTSTNDDKAIIEISDTGMGIDEMHITKITDPFFTTKDPGKGTGLGLSITYSIIMDHKGQIEFESIKNEGTTVRVQLPINQS